MYTHTYGICKCIIVICIHSAKGFMCMHVQLDRCSISSYHCWTGEVSVLISATTACDCAGS